MKEQIENLYNWLKTQDIDGAITGSYMLEYVPEFNQDLDLFVYDENSLRKILFACEYNPMFQLLEPLEKMKWEEYRDKGQSSLAKLNLITIKFKYNLCIDLNIVFKKFKTNIFSVLSSFDLDIICKGYDIKTKQYLDIGNRTQDNIDNKIADWNRWNNQYYNPNIWKTNQLLRQLVRCIKYHERGYNTDLVVNKYIDLIDRSLNYNSVYKSVNFDEKLEILKKRLVIIKEICQRWLIDHIISEEEHKNLDNLIKEL